MILKEKLERRLNYYIGALSALYRHGGRSELLRGLLRIALRKPSDAWRILRWKSLLWAAQLDRAVVSFPKFQLMLDAKDIGIATELAIDRMHEPIGTAILLKILEDGMTIIELGANIGYYTMQEATHKKLKKIIAIEPHPVNFELLNANIQLNHCEQVQSHNLGISDRDGILPFYVTAHSNVCSFIPRPDYDRIIEVPVLKLDSFVEREKIQNVDMIRMDIEGYEVNALKSMLALLKRDRPWLCLEYHGPAISDADNLTFIETLEDLGYELKCFTFRWSDYPIFGQPLMDPKTVVKYGELREILSSIRKQVLLLFVAPKERPFTPPQFE